MTEANPITAEQLRDALRTFKNDTEQGLLGEALAAVETLKSERSRPAPPVEPRDSESSAKTEVRVVNDGPPNMTRSYRWSPIEVRDCVMDLYERLPEAEQRYRNPRTDELCRTYIQALSSRNTELAIRACREADDYYMGHTRAALLEGAPNADSGLGDGSGAGLIPLPLAGVIVLARNKAAKMRGIMANYQMNAQTLRIPAGGVVTSAMTAENAIATDNTPVVSDVVLSAKKAQSHFSASMEQLDDSAFNIVSFFSERGGASLGALEDVQVCTSNGTAPNITGSLDGTTITSVAEATSTVLIYEDLVDLKFAVPEQYRVGSVWFGNSVMMGFLSKILDGNGRPIFTPSGAAPATVGDVGPASEGVLLGHRVYDVPVADGGIYFGNPAFYAFGSRAGVRVEASADAGWDNDVTKFKITERFDGMFVLTDPWRSIDGILSVA
jgi:HK97 family phage major capsid protein